MLSIERRGGSILTYTGRTFWPLDPRPEDIDVRDIAHALSLQCRFSGHCREFYSVAQHSCLVAEAAAQVNLAYALPGLLHDASEAYLIDLPSPLKRADGFETYRAAEHRAMGVIWCQWPGQVLPPNVSVVLVTEAVHLADERLLRTEVRDLMPMPSAASFPWLIEDVDPLPYQIRPVSPKVAERGFLDMAVAYSTGGKRAAAKALAFLERCKAGAK